MAPREVPASRAFVGAVLTGGSSTRMGRDKALLSVEGVPMAARVARALFAAGAQEVFLVGGDPETLDLLGLRIVPDGAPHEGPLAGVIAALMAASEEVVVVTACDMPWIDERHAARLVDAVVNYDVAVSAADGQLQPLFAAWARATVKKLDAAFHSGERSPLGVIRGLNFSVVDFGVGAWSIDLDTPGDVARSNIPLN